jgi:predicted dienelactone hydrolase
MFKPIKYTIAAAAVAATLGTAAAAEVGVMNFTFDAPHRDRLMQALVTYPAQSGGFPEVTGNNVVFKGVLMGRDAKPERRRHPLVILSHGSGGSAASLSWLSKALADAGYVVIAPNHQGSTSGDSTPETTIPATWLRKSDVTTLLDAVAESPSLSAIVDMDSITAIGFSLGGHTVLGLVGAELRAKALAENCDSDKAAPGCVWLKQGNGAIKGQVDLHKIDAEKFNARYFEPRIKAVIAIDPAFVPAYDLESIKSIQVPVNFINLGNAAEVPAGINAEPLTKLMPDAHFSRVEGANHFSFLAECKWYGGLLIMWEGDDPVCRETGNRSRAEFHDEIAAKIVSSLKGNLQN